MSNSLCQEKSFNMSELRRKKGLSQEELAKKLGVRRATVSDWENGKYMPSNQYLILLSEALETPRVEIEAYFEGKPTEIKLKEVLKEAIPSLLSCGYTKKEILEMVKDAFEA